MTKKKDLRPIRLLKRTHFRNDANELAPDQKLAKLFYKAKGTLLVAFTIQHEDHCLKHGIPGRAWLVASVPCTCNHPRLFDRHGNEFVPGEDE